MPSSSQRPTTLAPSLPLPPPPTAKPEELKQSITNPITSDAVSRMLTHLEDNKVDPEKEIFIGTDSELANPMLKETYRKGFEIIV